MAELTQEMRWAMRDAGVDKGLSADLDEMRQREEEFRAAVEEFRRKRTLSDRQREYHAAMAGKYRLVARLPWLPVEPDPPEPQ
jgi:hypothetical protein